MKRNKQSTRAMRQRTTADVILGRESGAITDLFSNLEYEPTFRQEPKRYD